MFIFTHPDDWENKYPQNRPKAFKSRNSVPEKIKLFKEYKSPVPHSVFDHSQEDHWSHTNQAAPDPTRHTTYLFKSL